MKTLENKEFMTNKLKALSDNIHSSLQEFDNSLLGFELKLSQDKFQVQQDGLCYHGTINLRTACQIIRYDDFVRVNLPSASDNCISCVSGGYSSWQGPWNKLGLDLNKYEYNLPHEHRRMLWVYAYAITFNFDNSEDMKERKIMTKLSDLNFPTEISYDWQDAFTINNDKKHIAALKKLYWN